MPGMLANPRLGEPEALHRLLDEGFLLPTQWYGDPAIFEIERRHVLRRSWHFATHTGDLKAPGDVYIRDIAGVPIVLVHGTDGAVRGFINICRHRGHPVVMESGSRLKLRCHFHGWTYGLDGELQHAPRSETDEHFDPAQFGLVPVQTHVWGPMVWVNLDMDAPSFDTWIDGMPQVMVEHGCNVEDHVYAFGHSWDIDANWKVFQDNTIECYHCPTTHPELAQVLEMRPELQKMFVGGRYWIHHEIPFRPHFKSSLTTQAVEGRPFNYYYHWVFPTKYIQFAGRGFDVGSIDVIAVDKIRFTHICFLPPTTPPEILAKGQAQIEADPTIRQDVELCARVQIGHATGLAPTARVLAGPESLLSYLQHLIVDMMAEGREQAFGGDQQ